MRAGQRSPSQTPAPLPAWKRIEGIRPTEPSRHYVLPRVSLASQASSLLSAELSEEFRCGFEFCLGNDIAQVPIRYFQARHRQRSEAPCILGVHCRAFRNQKPDDSVVASLRSEVQRGISTSHRGIHVSSMIEQQLDYALITTGDCLR